MGFRLDGVFVLEQRLATDCSAIHFNPSRENVRENIDIWIAYNMLNLSSYRTCSLARFSTLNKNAPDPGLLTTMAPSTFSLAIPGNFFS